MSTLQGLSACYTIFFIRLMKCGGKLMVFCAVLFTQSHHHQQIAVKGKLRVRKSKFYTKSDKAVLYLCEPVWKRRVVLFWNNQRTCIKFYDQLSSVYKTHLVLFLCELSLITTPVPCDNTNNSREDEWKRDKNRQYVFTNPPLGWMGISRATCFNFKNIEGRDAPLLLYEGRVISLIGCCINIFISGRLHLECP